tara:strand:+ start:115 stop:375 length:261 start_codon:yes stop_codon:yes gene_type:complete
MKNEKTIFIRCSEETLLLAKALAEHENRSVNKQIIHLIHSAAKKNPILAAELSRRNTDYPNKKETKYGLVELAKSLQKVTRQDPKN